MSGNFGKSSDRKLIDRIAGSDKAAIQALFARYHVRIYRFIVRMVGNESVAEQLANEVFLDVWRQARRFKSHSSVSTWLMAIARNKAIAHLHDNVDTTHDPDSDMTDSHEKNGRKAGKGRAIRRAIDKLSPDHRAIIDLAYYHELSIREVARVLDMPTSLVKKHMLQARKEMAAFIEKLENERGWP